MSSGSWATVLVDFGTWFSGNHGVLCFSQHEIWSFGALPLGEQVLKEGKQDVPSSL